MSAKTLGALAAVTLVTIIIAAFLVGEKQDRIPHSRELLFPGLKARLNDIEHISVLNRNQSVTITQSGGFWAVKEKKGFRAGMDRVRGVLIGLAELRILEPKTRKPELYAKLGVEDVEAPGSASMRISLKAGEEVLADVLVGNSRPARPASLGDEVYVRKPGDPQAFLTIGRLKVPRGPDQWIDTQLLNLDDQRISKVVIHHPDGEKLELRREKPTDADFAVRDLPEKAKLSSPFAVNNVASSVAHLALDDAHPVSELQLPSRGGVKVALETFDGMRVKLRLVEKDGKHYAAGSAEFDGELVRPSEPAADQAEPGGEPEEINEEGTVPSPLKAQADVEVDVEELNRRLSGWVFEIPAFRAESITKRQEDLIQKKA